MMKLARQVRLAVCLLYAITFVLSLATTLMLVGGMLLALQMFLEFSRHMLGV